jgi:membrane protease YdiL (CAAX protease family)
VAAAVLFGLWHLIPTTSVAAGNAGVKDFADSLVLAGGVAGTALVGFGFSWMRDRWGLAAPVLLHAIANSVAFAVAWTMV